MKPGALHARVRQLCGDRKVDKCLIHAEWALIEFPKEVVVIVVRGKKFQEITLTNDQAPLVGAAISSIFGG
jgi:hypothetical protein